MTSELTVKNADSIWKDFVGMPRTSGVKPTLNSFLYQKYASSQNYYYTKDLNDILTESRSAAAFTAKDWMQFDTVRFIDPGGGVL